MNSEKRLGLLFHLPQNRDGSGSIAASRRVSNWQASPILQIFHVFAICRHVRVFPTLLVTNLNSELNKGR